MKVNIDPGTVKKLKATTGKKTGAAAVKRAIEEYLRMDAVQTLIDMGGKHPEIAKEYYGEHYDKEDRASLV